MKSLILVGKSLFVIASVIAIGTKITGAYFTDQKILASNSVAAGELSTSITNEGTVPFAAENMIPGSTYTLGPVLFENTSNIDLKYQIVPRQGDGDAALFDKLFVRASRFNGSGYDQWYDGELAQMSLGPSNVPFNAVVAPNSGARWKFEIYLPAETDNSVQGKSVSFDLVFDSTQVTNPGWN